MLPEENISKEEAESYIKELIGNQILISDKGIRIDIMNFPKHLIF